MVHLISPYILKATPFDPVADFTGVTEIAEGPLLISASKNVPASNIAEFIAQAKQDQANSSSRPPATEHPGIWRSSCCGGLCRPTPPRRQW